MGLGILPAFAGDPSDGSGTESSPYSGTVSDWDLSSTTSSDTIYISGLSGYWVSGNKTFAANLVINGDGLTINDGYSSSTYIFTGDISGAGNWTHSTSQDQRYTFTGSLANYSGNITFTNGAGSYFHFGNGGQAATDTNVTGTGSVTIDGNITFNYSDYASDTSTAIAIGNRLIEALTVEFTGSVNYNVSSTVTGYEDGTNTLTISNSGTTTFESAVSGFSTVTVGSNSTLAIGSNGSLDLSGATVNLGSTIQNSGTVTIDSDTNIVVGSFASIAASGDLYSSTYTLISGGTISGYGSITSSNLSFSDYSTVTNVSISNSGSSIVVTVTGDLAGGLHGNGTIESPYFTIGTTAVNFTLDHFTGAGTTVYFATDEFSFGNSSENIYWNTSVNAECNIVIGAAGIHLTNGGSSNVHTFSGSISGTGNWTVSNENGTGVTQHYVFTGDMSEWSGDFAITSGGSSYVHYGDGLQAATDTNVSGTGSISVTGNSGDEITFNYSGYADESSTAIVIGNESITAQNLTFSGSVNYVISADTTITGTSSSGGTFTVSTEGTVTILGTLDSNNGAGFANLSVAEGSTLRIGADNTFYQDSTSGNNINVAGTLEVAEGVSFTLRKRTAATNTTISNLSLENGSTFTLITSGNSPTLENQGLAIGTLTVSKSATATIKTGPSDWQNYISIGAVVGEDATLTLSSDVSSSVATIFELGSSENTESTSQFTGKIVLSDTNSGSRRSVGLVISEENVAAGAVIEFGTESASDGSLSLGVNAERVEIAGLSDASNHNGGAIIYSGKVTVDTDLGTNGGSIASNSEGTNTLAINVADGEEYSFSGKFLDKLNIEKLGVGTQSITFESGSTFDGEITVSAGKLALGGYVSASTITVATGSELELSGEITLGAAIENAGTILIDEGTTFVLDNLEAGHVEGSAIGYYELITGTSGSIVNYTEGSITFTYNGSELDGWTLYVDSSTGNVYVYGEAGSFTWAGTNENNTWSLSQDDKPWEVGTEGDRSYFVSGSDVTFGTITEGSPYSVVNVAEDIEAGSITINDSYSFTTEVAAGVVVQTSGLEFGDEGKLTIGDGVTVEIVGTLDEFVAEGKIEGKGTLQIAFTADSNYSATVNLGLQNSFEGTVYITAGNFTLNGSDIGETSTFRLGDGVNMTVTASGVEVGNNFILEGTSEVHVNGGDSLTINGSVTGVVDGDGNMGGVFDRRGAGSLTINGDVNIGTFIIDTSGSDAVSETTFSGESVTIGKFDVEYADSVVFSNENGSVTISEIDFVQAGTIEFANGGTVGKIDLSTANGAGTIIVSGGTLDVGTIENTFTNTAHATTLEVAEGAVLHAEKIDIAPGSAGSVYSTISGTEEGSGGTVIADSFIVGAEASTSGGTSIEVSDVTLVVGAISFGNGENSNFNLYLKNATLGFTEDVTISATTANNSTSRFVLGGFASGNSTATGSGTTTTINTSRYDVDSGDFTSAGVTVTISQIISGQGELVVDGVGKLILSAANTYSGGTTIASGATVVVQDGSALGSGNVTVNSGATLELDTHVTVDTTSSNVTFAVGASIVLGGSLLDSILDSADTGEAVAVITANTITFGDVSVSDYTSDSDGLSEIVNQYVTSGTRYGITWSWDGNTLWAVASIPEPSMFGLLFGLGAAALTATRRRRREAA